MTVRPIAAMLPILAVTAAGPVLPGEPPHLVPVPAQVADHSTVELRCSTMYQGTLDLTGRKNVSVRTAGKCGKASITPGSAVAGWRRYKDKIFFAPISFTPVQVAVSGTSVHAAHWPNLPALWAAPNSIVPVGALEGARHVWRENLYVIKTALVSGASIDRSKPFYVEGKLWMLDSPGEWAVQNGRLYLWTPDGQSPEGKVWAGPGRPVIKADGSSGITIDSVKLFSGLDGINADGSTDLKVIDSEINNSARDGIGASGSRGLQVSGSSVSNSRRNGIDGGYSVKGANISNSVVNNTGMVGKPTPSDAAIMVGDGSDNTISNVRVTKASYNGAVSRTKCNTGLINSGSRCL